MADPIKNKVGNINPISQVQGGEGGGNVNIGDASGQANQGIKLGDGPNNNFDGDSIAAKAGQDARASMESLVKEGIPKVDNPPSNMSEALSPKVGGDVSSGPAPSSLNPTGIEARPVVTDGFLKRGFDSLKGNALRLGGAALGAGVEGYDSYKDITSGNLDTTNQVARAAEGVGRFGSTMAGGEIGAGLGSLAGPAGTIVGGLVGAGVGAFAPEAVNAAYNRFTGNNNKLPSQLAEENKSLQNIQNPNQPQTDKQGFVGPIQPTASQESARIAASLGIDKGGNTTPTPPAGYVKEGLGGSYHVQSPMGGTGDITPGQRNTHISNPSSGLTDGGTKIGYQSTPETRQALGDFINRDSSQAAVDQRAKDVADVAARRPKVDPVDAARERAMEASRTGTPWQKHITGEELKQTLANAGSNENARIGADATRSTAESTASDKALGRQIEGAKIMDERQKQSDSQMNEAMKMIHGQEGVNMNPAQRLAILKTYNKGVPITIHNMKSVYSGDDELSKVSDPYTGSQSQVREWGTKRGVKPEDIASMIESSNLKK